MSDPHEMAGLRARASLARDVSPAASTDSSEPGGAPHDGIANLLGHGRDIEICELDKSGHVQRRWLHTPDDQIIPMLAPDKSNNFFFRSMREWRKAVSDSFMPVGFPHSVSDDYLAYQTYDSLQAFFSTITSLLANRALLQGLGVGDANSSATFALLLTILKDAMSRIATIVFAHRFGLRIEPDAKKYRFLADVFNDTAFFLELYSPYFGPWGKVAALSTGEALRALCGVAAGASKAALSVHFAKHDNLAELNAKEASQETAVGLVGLMVGTLVVRAIEDHTSVVYLMTLLVFAHLWTNYLGVRSVCMNTFNRQRATILFQEYLKTGKVLSPQQVALREHVLFWNPLIPNRRGKHIARLDFAESYVHAMCSGHAKNSIAMVDGPMHTAFIWSHVRGIVKPIKILLWVGSEPIDAVTAWFRAMEIAWLMEEGKGYSPRLDQIFCGTASNDTQWNADAKLESPYDELNGYETRFNSRDLWDEMAEKGWNLDTQAFETKAPVRLSAQTWVPKDE